jgi:cysteine desulfurase
MQLPTASQAPLYLDACATTPLGSEARAAMEQAQEVAWANPSSLHGFGLAAAEVLERARMQLARSLGASPETVRFCSGATESVHLALLGAAAGLPPGRLLISAVEHPAVTAAAGQLARRGWQVERLPVDSCGRVELEILAARLAPPTRLVSILWGQSEIGTLQPLQAIGQLCQAAGVLLHTDAVQVAPHQAISFESLPVDLLSLTAHKLQGPRGVGALLVKPHVQLEPQLGGGSQERGLRAGTEPVVLAVGFAAALEALQQRLQQGELERLLQLRNALLSQVLELPGVRLSGPHPAEQCRLPHHISVLVQDQHGRPLAGRRLVRELWRQGVAASSGSACSSGGSAASPVLLALGLDRAMACSGLRLSLGPWLEAGDLQRVPGALAEAIAACQATAA